MSEIISLTNSYYADPAALPSRGDSAPRPTPNRTFGERVSMADADANVQSSFRRAWLAAIRRQIRDGAFDTPERLEGTIDRLLPLVR